MEPRVGIVITGAPQHEALAGEFRALRALGIAAQVVAADARFAADAFRDTVARLAADGVGALLVAGGPEAVALAETASDLPVVALDPAQPELAAWRAARILALAQPEIRVRLGEYRQMRARQDAFERTRLADLERRRTGDAAPGTHAAGRRRAGLHAPSQGCRGPRAPRARACRSVPARKAAPARTRAAQAAQLHARPSGSLCGRARHRPRTEER